MVNGFGHIILSEGVTSQGLQLVIGKYHELEHLQWQKNSFYIFIRLLHPAYTIFHVCYNLSYQ